MSLTFPLIDQAISLRIPRRHSSRSPFHTLCRNSKYELSRQFISCVVPLQNHVSPTTILPTGTGRTIRLFIPRNQCPTLQFRYCLCSCMELSFLQFTVGFVGNYKHSATIPCATNSSQITLLMSLTVRPPHNQVQLSKSGHCAQNPGQGGASDNSWRKSGSLLSSPVVSHAILPHRFDVRTRASPTPCQPRSGSRICG